MLESLNPFHKIKQMEEEISVVKKVGTNYKSEVSHLEHSINDYLDQ